MSIITSSILPSHVNDITDIHNLPTEFDSRETTSDLTLNGPCRINALRVERSDTASCVIPFAVYRRKPTNASEELLLAGTLPTSGHLYQWTCPDIPTYEIVIPVDQILQIRCASIITTEIHYRRRYPVLWFGESLSGTWLPLLIRNLSYTLKSGCGETVQVIHLECVYMHTLLHVFFGMHRLSPGVRVFFRCDLGGVLYHGTGDITFVNDFKYVIRNVKYCQDLGGFEPPKYNVEQHTQRRHIQYAELAEMD